MPTNAELLLLENTPPNLPKNATKRAKLAFNLAMIRGRINTLQKRLKILTVPTPPKNMNVLMVRTPSPGTLAKAKQVLGKAEYNRLMSQARRTSPLPTKMNVLMVRTPSPGTLAKAKQVLGKAEYNRLMSQAIRSPPKPHPRGPSPPKPRRNYASMSVKNLQKIARNKGYKGFSKFKKNGLVRFLQNRNG